MTKILIVEDEPNMRMGLRDNLEFEGYEVDSAEDGQEGLDKILDNKNDIMDLSFLKLCSLLIRKVTHFKLSHTIRN